MMSTKRKILLGILIAVAMTTGLVFAHAVTAQTTDQITAEDLGLSYGEATGLSNTDIRLTIARIIRVALGFLGVVALVLILYGGFVWMTAGGNEENIQKAKKILVNAVIGLIIILSAYAIASFVINALVSATGAGGGGDGGEGGGGGGFANSLYIVSMPGNDFGCGLRNLHPVIVFRRPVDLTTVQEHLIIRTKVGGVQATGTWHFVSPTQQDSVVFDPVGDCGVDGQTDCLDASTTYQMMFLSAVDIKSQTGDLSLNCNAGSYKKSCQNDPAVEFTTGTGVDTEPPTISITNLIDGDSFAQGSSVEVKIEYTDNYGLQNLSLFADNIKVNTIPISGCQKFGTTTMHWPTGGTATGTHAITALATDKANLTASTTKNINLIPAHCFDDILDPDEDQVGPPACGADSECGHCGGDSCTEDSDCASGWCEGGICVDRMKINFFDPTEGAASSTYVTISGNYFGNDGGNVYFTKDGGGWTEAFVVNCGAGIDNWTSSQLVVKVPKNAATGPIRVITATTTGPDMVERQFTDTTDDDGWGYNNDFTVNTDILPGLCALQPNSGAPFAYTILLGEGFGSSADKVLFGSAAAYTTSWADKSITARVPALGTGNVAVKVEVDGKLSNALRYTVRELLDADTPIIESISPDHGAKGEYITITGKNFGNYQGEVWFKLNGVGEAKLGTADFPAECEGSTWSDTRVIIKFPTDGVTAGNTYSVQVLRSLDAANSPIVGIDFDLESGNPAPGICALNPLSGPIPLAEGSTMKIYGEYYTRDGLSMPYFWQTSASATTTVGRTPAAGVVSESDTAAELYPSHDTETGPVVMHRTADGKIGNDLPFTVYNCLENNNKCSASGYQCCTKEKDAGKCIPEGDLCAGSTRSTGYIWRFNTGPFPPTARVVERCNAATDFGDNLPSPSPDIRWTSGGNTDQYNVCRTALVNIEFSMEMLASTINQNNIKIFECASIPSTSTLGANINTCAHGTTAITMQPTSYDLFVAEGEETGGSNNFISMSPVGDAWDDNTYYQVVLSDDLKSAPTSYYYGDEIRYLGEQSLKATRPCGDGTAYCFIFRTDSQTCTLNQVIITPKKYWTAVLEAPMNYRVLKDNASDPGTALYYKGNGLSDQHCIMMNMKDFDWTWNTSDAGYAATYGAPTGINGNLTQVSALANTVAVGLVDPDNAVNIIGTATKDDTVASEDVVTGGLNGWWKLDNNGIDSGGGGKTANFTGSYEYQNNGFGRIAVHLDGDGDYAVINNPTDFDGGLSDRTMCGWGKPDDVNFAYRWIASYGHGDIGQAMFIGMLGTTLVGGGFGDDLSVPDFWEVGTWHHVCLTYDGIVTDGAARLYADGELLSQTSKTWNLVPDKAYIGAQVLSSGPGEFWNGSIDDVRIYDRVLSDSEIIELYEAGIGDDESSSSESTFVSKTGVSPLTVDLSNPKVVDYWPNCLEACTNAEVAAKFNILMSSYNLNDNTVKLDICKDENCSVLEEVAIAPKLSESDSRTIIISLADLSAQLATNTIYQVTLSRTGTSTSDQIGQLWSGASSTDANLYSKPMQTQFVWRFKTKNEKCVVDKVQIMPALFSAIYINDKKVYSAEARSAPDACNAKGQPLNAWSIDWLWQSSTTSVATVQSFETRGHNNACSANCIKKGSDIAFGLALEPLCGNDRIEAGEDCDPPAKNGSVTSCTLDCLRPGSAPPTCGNGTIESAYGEECEPDISASNGCSANCLNMGSNVSTGAEDIGASICGNGTVGKGEDCDLGIGIDYLNPSSTLYCSANCLHVGTSLSANWCAVNTTTFGGFAQDEYLELCATAMSQCGDGIASPGEDAVCETGVETNPVNSNCTINCLANSLILAECTPTSSDYSYGYLVEKKTEGCSALGQHEGSSLLYSEPSVCGDEIVGIGEDSACESGFVITHNYTDPWTLAVGVGLGTPVGEPPAQITNIIGTGQQTIGTKTYTASGKGQFKIMCGYTTDAECQLAMGSSDYGVGSNSCCYNIAKLISTYPIKSTAPVYDICPNTYIEAKFDRLIDQNTLANGVFIARGYEGEHVCAIGTVDVTELLGLAMADLSDGGALHWFAKIWHRIIGWVKNIFGDTASAARTSYVADVFCAVKDYGTATVVSDMAMGKYTTSTVVINLNIALATNTDYAVILSRDVRDMLGVSIGGSAKWRFITADEICTLNNVTVNPSGYMFTQSGVSANFTASSTAANGQRIQPVFGYAWEYTWGPAVNDIINLTNTTSSINLVSAKNRNGEIVLTATADITQNIVGAPDVSLSGQSDVAVFLCENPWPSASASEFPFYETSYDFSTFYCRDYGSPGFADDLPYMTSTAVYTAASSDFAKRYVFTNTDNKDAIGMQIFFNPDYFSVNEWYANEGFSGGVGALKVDGYEALGNSFNYYIDALKTQTEFSNTIYPNIYQFSLNNDATGETSEVFKQMMNNLKFNKKVRNEAFCADDLEGSDINYSMPCANDMDCRALADAANKNSTSTYVNNFICMNLKDKLQRNYVRLKDLRNITKNITYGRGLIGAWSMDAINYGRVADVSGHNMDGVVYGTGISITTGTIGQAMHLVQPYYSSSNSTQRSYLKLSQGTTIGKRSFTVGQWLKTTSTLDLQPSLISNTSGPDLLNRNGFRLGLHYGRLHVSLGSGGSSSQYTAGVCSAKYVNDGVWHHVAAVFEREQPDSSGLYHIDCYVDGVLDGSIVMGDPIAPYYGMTEDYATNPVRIGTPSYHGTSYSTAFPFVADYDDVRIYGRSLNADEISAWYANNLPVDANAKYPKMAGNTFLTGQALSVWPDSWTALSSEIGFTLSTDPINKLAQAGTCYLPNTSGGYSACYKDSDCAPVSALGRLSYWTADNGDATDEGTLANKGSMVGAVSTNAGKGHGKAFSFSGDSAANVSLPHKNEYNNDTFTVSAWIYPTKKNTATIIKKGGTDDSGASQGGFALEYSGMQFDGSLVHFNNGTIRFAVFPASSSAVGYYAIDSATPITINAWHHIIAVFNKTAGKGALYIDGAPAGGTFRMPPTGAAASVNDIKTAAFNEMNLEIGESFNGLIDNVAFYSRVLESIDITNIRKGLCVLHDTVTGWSAEDRRFSFVCNTSSYAYRYTYVSSTDSFLLRANLEQFASLEPNNWSLFKKAYVGNWVDFNYGICAANDEIASPYHVSCGDNVLGGSEECDPPGKMTYDSSACPSGSALSKICGNQCKWLPSSSVTCREVAGGSCGDGKTQSLAGETCDDGALNGTNGRCNTNCDGIVETCGNNFLDPGEFCDSVTSGDIQECAYRAGVSTHVETLPEPIYYFLVDFSGSMLDSWESKTRMKYVKEQLSNIGYAFDDSDTPAKMGIGVFSNNNPGFYDAEKTLPAGVCRHKVEYLQTGFNTGDVVSSTVNNTGFSALYNCGTWTGDGVYWFRTVILPEILSDSDNFNRPINLVLIVDGAEGSTPHLAVDEITLLAGSSYNVKTYVLGVGSSAPSFNIWAEAGDTDEYIPITMASNLASVVLSTYYSRSCSEYNFYSGYSCAWDCNGFGGFCGDGILAPGFEECESDQTCAVGGNAGVNKCVDCLLQGCVEDVAVSGPCGDGEVDEEEACDRGDDNGIKCFPAYPQLLCTYCSADCKNVVTVDLTCGNGVLDTSLGEVCDPAGAIGGHVRTSLPWYGGSWLPIPGDYCYSCNDTCTGWDYTEINSGSSVCAPYLGFCGDGIKQQLLPLTSGWEECDIDATGCPACPLSSKKCTEDCECGCTIGFSM